MTSSDPVQTASERVRSPGESPTRGTAFAVRFRNGDQRAYGTGPPAFVLEVADEAQLRKLFHRGVYGLAMGFIGGEFNVDGDLAAAVRHFRESARRGPAHWLLSLVARYGPWRLEWLYQSRPRSARNIRFHYDRSNDFYRQFLDSRLVYSCAYFKEPEWSLEEAQLAKLEHICRKLDLRRNDRFLDVGSGWGALVLHAAQKYGVHATGCTLSQRQFSHAAAEAAARGFSESVRFREMDYRSLEGEYDKIASVGMFEHVGRRRLRGYFEKIASLLAPGGLFLNHGISRPQDVRDDAEGLILKRHVFPGGEFVHLSDVVREAENAGFEVLDVENLRPHYALTCRAWVARLQQHAEQCLHLVGLETHRTWLLFLAASADSFEQGEIDVYQVLLAKRAGPRTRRLTRGYMYAD